MLPILPLMHTQRRSTPLVASERSWGSERVSPGDVDAQGRPASADAEDVAHGVPGVAGEDDVRADVRASRSGQPAQRARLASPARTSCTRAGAIPSSRSFCAPSGAA